MSEWKVSVEHSLDHVRVKGLSGTLTGPCQSQRSQWNTDWIMSEWKISAAHWLDHIRVKDFSGTVTGPCQSERSQEHTNPCQSERSQEHTNPCQSERSQEYAGLVTLQWEVSVARRQEDMKSFDGYFNRDSARKKVLYYDAYHIWVWRVRTNVCRECLSAWARICCLQVWDTDLVNIAHVRGCVRI